MDANPTDLVAFCGGYCGKCGICGTVIGVRLQAVRNLLEAAGFRREAERLGWPLMREIATGCCAQLEQHADSFAELAGKLFPTHCRDGCVPPCEIARCCREKGFTTCAECEELDGCARFDERHQGARENLRDIRETGLQAWAEQQFADCMHAERKKLVEAVECAFE